MSLRFIPTYRDMASGVQVQFIPLAVLYDTDTPGFSHRVFIDHKPIDWLSGDTTPNADAAQYFINKHK